MSTDQVALTDAIVTAIETAVPSLPAHGTWKYVEPRELRADKHAHWLVVYPTRLIPEIISTESNYDNQFRFVVSWHANVFKGLESNVGDDVRAREALLEAQAIRLEIEEWGAGLPGAGPNDTAVLFQSDYGLERNGLWVAKHQIDVEIFE